MKKSLVAASTAVLAAVALLATTGTAAAEMSLTLPLNNATAGEGADCPSEPGAYCHFVISPNNGGSMFITFHLNLDDATTYDTSSPFRQTRR